MDPTVVSSYAVKRDLYVTTELSWRLNLSRAPGGSFSLQSLVAAIGCVRMMAASQQHEVTPKRITILI
jgi:hypothetical protein